MDAELEFPSAENSELSKVLSVNTGVGQFIALYALLTSKICACLNSTISEFILLHFFPNLHQKQMKCLE